MTGLRRWRAGALSLLVVSAAPVGVRAQETRPPAIVAPPVAPLVRPAVEAADSLFDALDAVGALRRLEARIEAEPDDFEALWRAGRAALSLGVIARDADARRGWLDVGVGYAERARTLRPDDLDTTAWLAALKGRLALESDGSGDRARLAQEVWDLTGAVLAQDSTHAFANDIRGKANQEVMRLNRIQRFFARVFIGNDPLERSSWEQAEAHLRRAIESDPTVVLFYLDLGETYLLRGKREEAIATLVSGLALPIRLPPDGVFRAKMETLLAEARAR